jgi:hypothetical protein
MLVSCVIVDDLRECEEELAKLKDGLGTDYSSQHHHGYRRTKASRNNEEYRKCASQARERVEREGTCEG